MENMNSNILIWIFFLHFIADFLLQSREMAKNKSENLNYLMKHLFIQFIVIFIGLLMCSFDPAKCALFSGINAVIHGIIDWNIWRTYKRMVLITHKSRLENFKYWEDPLFYMIIGFDQTLHMSTLLLLYGWIFYVK
jgi:uncharacterized protein DUF3307